ncbi:MAG: helix-turn-helix transcriptional regulator [Elusimicrobiaceae bacterium]|nr:helix-turn-helix transcriptional regulator [Elusimicrobiaceae bacterium]
MDLGQKIEKLLKLTSMTKVELAKKLGLKDSSVISHWVKNRFRPDRKNLQKLSATFNKPLSYFEEDLQETAPSKGKDSFEIREGTTTAKSLYELISSLPSSKHIGVALEIQNEFFDLPYTFEPEEFLPVMFDAKNKETFALRINSKVACPWAEKGEFALFVASESVQSGKIALIRYRNRYTIKKLTLDGEDILLSTPTKKTKVSQNEIIIVAKLMAFYRRPN